MKSTIDPLKTTYDLCVISGKIKEVHADKELVRSLVHVAGMGLEFINVASQNLPQRSVHWTFVFRDYYESLRQLIDAYLLLDGIEADNHQCKNAYICFPHPELELNWVFLETIRLRRNAFNYRGLLVTHSDWKQFQLNFALHITLLQKHITSRLKG